MIIIYLKSKQNDIIYENHIYHIFTTEKTRKCNVNVEIFNDCLSINNSIITNNFLEISRVFYVDSIPKLYSYKKSNDSLYFRHFQITTTRNPAKDYYQQPIICIPAKEIIFQYRIMPIVFFSLLFIDCSDFIRFIESSILFLMDEPIGIKQNKIISNQIGQTILSTLFLLKSSNHCTFYHIYLYVKFNGFFVIRINNAMIKLISEIFDIFQSRNYNSLKRRYDRVDFEIDQVIISVFLLSIILLILYNIFGYYMFFMILNLIFIAFKVLIKTGEYYIHDFKLYVHKIVYNENQNIMRIKRVKRSDILQEGIRFACKKVWKENKNLLF